LTRRTHTVTQETGEEANTRRHTAPMDGLGRVDITNSPEPAHPTGSGASWHLHGPRPRHWRRPNRRHAASPRNRRLCRQSGRPVTGSANGVPAGRHRLPRPKDREAWGDRALNALCGLAWRLLRYQASRGPSPPNRRRSARRVRSRQTRRRDSGDERRPRAAAIRSGAWPHHRQPACAPDQHAPPTPSPLSPQPGTPHERFGRRLLRAHTPRQGVRRRDQPEADDPRVCSSAGARSRGDQFDGLAEPKLELPGLRGRPRAGRLGAGRASREDSTEEV